MWEWAKDHLVGSYSNSSSLDVTSADSYTVPRYYSNQMLQQGMQNSKTPSYTFSTYHAAPLDPMIEKKATLQEVHDTAKAYAYEMVLYA